MIYKWFGMFKNPRNELIEKYYNGNAQVCDKDRASDDPVGDAHFFRYGKRPTTHWRDIELHAKCHPEHEELALAWIRFLLGYLPQQHAYMPCLPYIQSLVQHSETGNITDIAFSTEMISYAKKIRNDDMKRGGWVYKTPFAKEDFDLYNRHLAVYKPLARLRLCDFLGYEPLLEHSLDAEVFLRQLFQEDSFNSQAPYCNADFKAGTIVMYRQAFLQKGAAAADDLALFERTKTR